MKKLLALPSIVLVTLFMAGCQNGQLTMAPIKTVPGDTTSTPDSTTTPTSTDVATTTTTPTADKGLDPCDLLTPADVQAVFPGSTPTNTRHDTEASVAGQKICHYTASDTEAKYVQLAIISDSFNSVGIQNGETAEKQYTDTKSFMKGAKTVTGVGDDAYYGSGSNFGGGLNVLIKAKGVKINVDIGLGNGKYFFVVFLPAIKHFFLHGHKSTGKVQHQ